MNKLCYRLIFNRVRGMLMVVSDITRSGYSRVARSPKRTSLSETRVRISPLSFALWLAAGVISLPAQANIVADSSAPGSQQPTVMATANGLPQINIQTPNSQGVSRNQYSQLDVDARGAILNNSHQNTATQLGGMVAANPWLSKQEATVILNEVNSRNPSQLNGFIEVAGKRAAVVIANPSGITCNGCGFINASRNTLTTGQALIENGQLKGFDVNGGRINIEGKGLNDSDADYTQIIAQSVAVNARVHAREINVVTGRNQVATEGNVTTVKADDGTPRPEFALDVAAIGGMYANKITLTGTEKGVGVRNAGELGASAGELHLTVDGRLENSGTLQSQAALQIASNGDQDNRGNIVSQQDVTLTSGGTLRNSGMVSAGRNATLSAGTLQSSAESTLAAGVDGNGTLSQPGNLLLTSQGELKAQGKNLAHNQIQAQGSRVDLAGSQTSADAIALTSTQADVSTQGATVAGRMLGIQAATALNNDDGKLAAGSLAIAAQNVSNNRGLLRQQNREALTLSTGSLLNNQGTLSNEGDTRLQAQHIENHGGLIAGNGDSLQLDTPWLDNQGGTVQLAGNGALTLNTTRLEGNQGNLLSAGALTLSGDRIDLSEGHTQAEALTLTAGTLDHHQGLLSQRGTGEMAIAVSGDADNRGGRIESGGNLRITSASLDNSGGTLLAAGSGDLQLQVQGTLTNVKGALQASRNLQLNSAGLSNQQGRITAISGDATLTTRQAIDNEQGRIETGQQLTLRSQGLDNHSGTVLGEGVNLDTQQGQIDNTGGNLVARRDLKISGGKTDNSTGLVQSGGDLAINTHDKALINRDSGKAGIVSGGALALTSGDLDNQNGVIAAASAATISSAGVTNGDGTLLSDGALTLNSGAFDNQRGLIQSGASLSLDTHGAQLTNTASGAQGGIVAGGDLLLSTGQIDGQNGVMLGQNVRIDTHQQTFDHQQGQLGAKGTLQLDSGMLNNRAGRIESGGDLNLDTHGNDLINRDSGAAGGLFSAGILKLYSGTLDNLRGFITGSKGAQIAAGDIHNQSGTLTGGKGRLDLTSGELQNQGGLLQAGSDMTLDTQGHTLINRDSGSQRGIVALNSLDLRSGAIDNQTGFIAAGNQATINATELNNSQGQIVGNGGLLFSGQALNNSDGKLQSAGDITLNTSGQTLANQRGLIASGGNLHIDSGALDNQQGQIQGGTDLTLNAGQNALFNQTGKLLSAGTLSLTAGQLTNSNGLVQSVGDGLLSLSQQLDNRSGLIQGGQQMTITTPSLINRDTRLSGKGIEAGSLTLEADTLDNSQGALRANQRLALIVQQALDNVSGLISSADTLTIQQSAPARSAASKIQQRRMLAINNAPGQTLTINNQQGTLIADHDAQINAAALSGDGQVLSQGDLGITLAGDFHNTSAVKANGTLRLTTAGDVINDGTLAAQQALFLTAQNINNQAGGEISGGQTDITAADTLNNRGLIDGDLTHLVAGILNNSGTGRIFGDHIAIAASLLNNLSEEGKAAVIAARQRLDIGAGTLNNRDHALIYSDGDLHIGGQLDANYQATGQGQQLNNDGATIEAGQDATISMAEINNTNRHLTTQVVTTEDSQHHDAVLKGHTDRFDWAKVDISKKNKYGVHTAKMPDGTSGSEFYEYDYRRVVKETQIQESDPGKILSGGNMTFSAGRLNNQDSQIVAGAVLGGQIGELNNQATKGTRVTTDDGKSVRWYAKKKKKKFGGTETSQGKDRKTYRPAPVTETIDLQTLSWQANAAPQGNGYQTGNRQQQNVTAQADSIGSPSLQQAVTAVALSATDSGSTLLPAGLRYDSTLTLDKLGSLKDRPLLLPAGQQFSLTLPATVVDGQTITPVIRAVSPDIRLPDNSLYQLQPGSGSPYLVETDPRFVNQKQWLSSDYMQNALTTDSSRILKRLGDGYYEQRLVRNQIIQLTGNRYISGYGSDEDQYRGLMNNGVAFGKAYNLEPGVALTPAQMALLTSDIVWLVNQTVTLADGTQQTVLVPQVYAKVKQGDLTGDGALIGGGSVALNARNDITNSGTIQGRDVTQLTAQSLTNSGYISGNTVNLTARQDITNLGGTLRGDSQLTLLAGRDITSQSTLRGDGTDRWIDRPAGIYVQGSDGALTLSALNNITLAASDIGNAGEKSTTTIQAGNDLTLGTLSTQHSEDDSWNSSNYRRLSQQSDAGTRISAGGALQLSAGQDIRATAADVTAGSALTASAGRDIVLSEGNSRTDLTEHSKQSSKGLLSGSSLETHDELHSSEALSTTLSGDSVRLQAGRDIAVTGSNVAGTQDVALTAGRDLSITTATETNNEVHQREEKKSGLMGTGGIGFTVGQAMQKSSTDASGALNRGSTVGSSDGSVILSAGNQLTVHGSDVIAGKDLSVSGSDVTVSAAENSHTVLTKTEQKQSGLTLALSGTVGAALNTAVQTARTADESDDGRLKALQGTRAALTAAQAAQAYQMDGAQTDAANARNTASGLKPGDKGYDEGSTSSVGISLSYGSQSSKSETRSESREAQGSTLGAGGNLNITATGAQPGSAGDILVQGSQLQAGGDLGLTAKNDISLLSAQNSERTDSTNSSRGGSAGIGLTAGSGGYGISVSASVNAGKGRANGNGLTHTGTTLTAGNGLSLNAGRDTTLTGAQVRGDSVKVDTGRNLTLTSEQDSDRYDSKQQNASAGGSFTFGSMTGSASVNLSQDKMHSNWQSVAEQTGIFAGKGGFDVTAGEHTQLNGAVISSTASADKNRLDTGTLGFSNIENHADYKTEHQSVGMSTGGSIGSQFEGNMANGLLAGLNGSGSASLVTESAVSDGTIVIRDKAKQTQDVSALSRDAEGANPGLDKIFDKDKEQRRMETAQLLAEIGSQAGDIARTQGEIAATKAATEKMKNISPDQRKDAEAQWRKANPGQEPTTADITGQVYQTLYNRAMLDSGIGTGGAVQQGISAATAAIQGLAGGNIAQAVSGAAAPYLAEQIHTLTTTKGPDGKDVVNVEANLIAHAVVGAVTAYASGNAALAGASGAAMGEYIAQQMYPGVKREDLSEEQRQTISALGTLAAGLAGGIAGDSAGGAVAGAQAGKNALENNSLLLPRPVPVPVPGLPLSPGDKVVLNANNKIASELDKTLKGSGTEADTPPITDGRAIVEARDEAAKSRDPNVAKDLTDAEKAELGGTGSGSVTPPPPENDPKQQNEKPVQKLNQKQESAIRKIDNTIKNALKDHDITGTLKDMDGNPVPKESGGHWDHMQEMQNTLRGLRNHADTLKNVNNSEAQAAYGRATDAINKIESALKGHGI
ncbi:filamentous hemagglutinin N-terminal domain-containing protein [Pantoea sp. Bo_2]|uniref:hemagglutinin repeat-containing protein n=1 Tax=unclassified Pantoea TaxID=2630326 RepID=UPI001232163E|nr:MULTISPECIES: hemagglutinin repeat-containing protein [unclassified Pantoea]KAA5950907.1 filamentous hemagglutinin N-terminal domain-containing protein [Pantoea sp. VH_3]KAA5956255.1 filamentous hemagglutinin N-terminal domain-containing protein [Pantoea sp. VH_25]KAA5984647.1 filamentous hemagglutinin N-terminal domain-containing protein [Pantoea sp. M_3]KAA6051748.1 filamentous hemagglutinin N-terminal domain-containing protein [Pantoea sp. FN_2b]KAA6055548.1 filamentous hemagglutinin N-t